MYVVQILSEIPQDLWQFEFFKLCVFVKNCENCYAKLWKMRKLGKWHILFFIISLKLFKLQRCTIPHFKALVPFFWPLGWLLTLGLIILAVWIKMSVHFFLLTLYMVNCFDTFFFRRVEKLSNNTINAKLLSNISLT